MISGIDGKGKLYPVEKIAAHKRDILHLALSVFVFDGNELLIQRRADEKYHCGGLWANTCCTHPNFGEDIRSAATRRMNEELGFTLPVEERLTVEYSANVGNGLWERERVHIFRAETAKEKINLRPNPHEVSETRWINPGDLKTDIKHNPDSYTPWFRIYVRRFPELNF